jgi:hypothetical protein
MIQWPERYADFAERVASATPLAPIAEGLIYDAATHLLCGAPRSGKTWFSLEAAVACSTGTPIGGLRGVAKPVGVLYCTEEDAERRVHDRIGGLLRGRGIDAIPETLFVSVGRRVPFDDGKWLAEIEKAIRRESIRVVIFDPLVLFSAKVGTTAAEFQAVNLFLRRLALETKCAVIVVHHDTKPLAGIARDTRDPAQRASGGGIFAAMDSPIWFKRQTDTAFVATPDQWKFCETPPPFGLSLSIDGDLRDRRYRLIASSAAIATAKDAKKPRPNRILDALGSEPGLTQTALRERVGGKAETLPDDLAMLQSRGLVVKRDGGFYLTAQKLEADAA